MIYKGELRYIVEVGFMIDEIAVWDLLWIISLKILLGLMIAGAYCSVLVCIIYEEAKQIMAATIKNSLLIT